MQCYQARRGSSDALEKVDEMLLRERTTGSCAAAWNKISIFTSCCTEPSHTAVILCTLMCRAHGRAWESGQIGLNRADIGPYRAV
jgi:hypothetical protein